MRCPKCGIMSFDHLEACASCSRDLRDVRQELGSFVEPDFELSWFTPSAETAAPEPWSAPPPPPPPEAQEPADLSGIDVSDLVEHAPEESPDIELQEIDPEALEAVAGDEFFQEALDQALDPNEKSA